MGEESVCLCAVTVVPIKDNYTHYFRLYLFVIYHYTCGIPGYGNTKMIHYISALKESFEKQFCKVLKLM